MRLFARLGVVPVLALALLVPAGQSQAVPTRTTAGQAEPTENKDWSIKPVAAGYEVTLRLATPVPMRAALPLLAVDGRVVGTAKESADRRTLTVVTQDGSVRSGKQVTLVWSTELGRGKAGRSTTDPTLLNEWQQLPPGPANAVDPAALGQYGVGLSEYNLGAEAIDLPDLGHKAELQGRVYTPVGATGPRPLVVFLHGRHQVCFGGDGLMEKPWPCTGGAKPVPSFRGYDSPAWALASHGYQVVSISANAINAWDSGTYDGGAMARAQLILAHLDLWKQWSTTGGGPYGKQYVGKVDLGTVGMMGHSRGGEGVARAALLNAQLGGKYGIRAVLPLAPVDFSRPTLPGVAMSVLLPYCDGDVVDLQGQKFYDDSRYAATPDQARRSTLLVLGTNHNFFNREWTPGQSVAPSFDDGYDDGTATSPCSVRGGMRLTAVQQQAVGRAYIAGFFRLELGREQALLPLFDGSNTRAASVGKAVVRVVSQAPSAQRRDVNRLDAALPAGAVSGAAKAEVCAGLPSPTVPAPDLPPCWTSYDGWKMPHWNQSAIARTAPTTAVTRLRWTGTSGSVRFDLPAGQRDVTKYTALSFRASPEPTGVARPDLSLRVTDGRGQFVNVPVSAISDALLRLPGANDYVLPKTLLRTVRLPLWWLGKLDRKDIRSVELRTDRTAAGTIYLSDLAFSGAGLGTSAPIKLPSVSVADAKATEGNTGTTSLDYWVSLSRPSAVPVTVWAETSTGDPWQAGPEDVSRRLVFKPGQTKQKVSVVVKANTVDDYDLQGTLQLSLPTQAIVGDAQADGVVLDDDPAPVLTIGNAVGHEASGKVRFPVRLSAVTAKEIIFEGQLISGTAKLGSDLQGYAPGINRAFGQVPAGRRVGWIQVDVLNDKVAEPAESFSIRVDKVEGVEFAGPVTRSGLIVDDDQG
ncbi:Calx-beta domain-containing protein [Kribbella lupini]|uniref:Calx-beta domain-containing protein n=1 Tax=Kribbella lupini TaxID=291602 RepID=A0ABP4MRT3_9ACTN